MAAAELALVQERHAAYAAALEQCGLEDRTVACTHHGKWKQWLIYMAYPLYLPGLLMNGLPVAMARRIADKRVYRTDFYSWIYVSCYCVLYLLWLVLTVMAVALFGWRWAGVWALAMGVTGMFSYRYREKLSEAGQYRRLKRLPAEQVGQLKLLRRAAQGGSPEAE
jgi:hypothetical protein